MESHNKWNMMVKFVYIIKISIKKELHQKKNINLKGKFEKKYVTFLVSQLTMIFRYEECDVTIL